MKGRVALVGFDVLDSARPFPGEHFLNHGQDEPTAEVSAEQEARTVLRNWIGLLNGAFCHFEVTMTMNRAQRAASVAVLLLCCASVDAASQTLTVLQWNVFPGGRGTDSRV